MLKYRMVFGPLMILALVGLIYLDDRLDQLSLVGTVWQDLFLGRTYLPAGLLMLFGLAILIVLASRELCHIFHAENVPASPLMLALSGTLGAILVYILPYQLDSQATVAIYASFMVGLFILSIIRHSFFSQRADGAVTVAAATMMALIYLGALPGFYLAIRRWHSAWLVAAILLIIKASDIGAYFTGRAIGRHKLIPWLSPGKTWEGFFGGLALSSLLAVAFVLIARHYDVLGYYHRDLVDLQRQFVPYAMPLWFAALAGVVLGSMSVVGDLTASLFKRDAGIKDSGKSIPGFGGVIDVVDSPILVAPFAYWLLILAQLLFSDPSTD